MHDLVLAGGHVLDPANNLDGPADVGIAGGRVAEVGRVTTGARRTIDVGGRYVLPGLIDTHAHLSRHFGSAEGHAMVAETGVVTVLDLAGDADDLAGALAGGGAGLNVAYLHPLIPDRTVPGRDPSADEVGRAVDSALEAGALGIKLLGGHYPLTPGATGRAMDAATARRCYLAFHVGTTETGSDVRGLAEALDLAAGRRIHIAHVNSYCRGQTTGDPVAEAQQALDLLYAYPSALSESYLSVHNGTSARCDDGIPTSGVTRTCLRLGGYEQTERGLEAAIRAGYARIHAIAGGRVILATPQAGLEAWRAAGTDAGISFPVNHIPSAILLATARRAGRFVIEALSTDGGSIPRNFLVRHGLMLVQIGAWTLRDFAVKASLNPARMLGIPTKGHLAVGADADVTVVDPDAGRAIWSVAGGRLVLDEGHLVGRGGAFITTPRGEAAVRARLGACAVVHAEGWGEDDDRAAGYRA
ncbi:MAG: amidohydrolase family protein [Armatimonadota bacterium]|nr:amidohydrolase family protein [Armatimonadota bacterium]MDR7421197.1 amidohydrolase family protein [Armatimonadota bacterium]MDR7456723.1 amidohydrolase family protein [Armatimonadota bacterium]MDR7496209.1 amidohydrolase family protein [Armatimonadota bacterium]MDR7511527.1 amidohydrolase family protein [Armatimonadota bacterium]